MKKYILFLYFVFGCCFFIFAQDSFKSGNLDILYLQNGKKVKGIIVKQQFGTISINITDSITNKKQIKIYQQRDIKKIDKADSTKTYLEGGINNKKSRPTSTSGELSLSSDSPNDLLLSEQTQSKELLTSISQPDSPIQLPAMTGQSIMIDGTKTGNPDDYFDPFSVPRPKRKEKIWNRQIRGFRGFVDYAYIQGIGSAKNHRMETATSLGFQFNPIFYTGIGLGGNLTLNKKDSSLPVFINSRINFIDDNTTPFLDTKVGYSVAMGRGFYFSTSFGVSFTKHGKRAFNLGLVYSL